MLCPTGHLIKKRLRLASHPVACWNMAILGGYRDNPQSFSKFWGSIREKTTAKLGQIFVIDIVKMCPQFGRNWVYIIKVTKPIKMV